MYLKAVVIGVVGGAIGVSYNVIVKRVKKISRSIYENFFPKKSPISKSLYNMLIAAIVGVVCAKFPGTMFWGEGQLQTVIDMGKTELPIFVGEGGGGGGGGGKSGKAAGGTTTGSGVGTTIWDPVCLTNDAWSTSSCSLLYALTKTLTTALSLSTSLPGGHFWSPLFIAVNVVNAVGERGGFEGYETVVVICAMGAMWVATFRAPVGIILVIIIS